MRWRRLCLRVPPADEPAASALLGTAVGAGVSAFEDVRAQERARRRSRRPEPILVCAYVPLSGSAARIEAAREALRRSRRLGILCGARLTLSTVRDEDWATSWKRFYRPSRLAQRLWVAPTWERSFRPPAGSRLVRLDPGMAFGTGQHPSTRLALRLLLPRIEAQMSVFDVGCGSGILGIAAAQLGARVTACDVDPIAVRATRANFAANGLRPQAVTRCDGLPRAKTKPKLIVANITADVLAPLARGFATALGVGGMLVTSGVSQRASKAMLGAFGRAGLALREERRSGEWRAFVHERRARTKR